MLELSCGDLGLYERVLSWARGRGFDLVGAISSGAFDMTQPSGRRTRDLMPECDTVLLLGTGGRRGWDALSRDLGAIAPPRPGYHPIDGWSRRQAHELLDTVLAGCPGRVVLPDHPGCPNLRQLGEMVGLGTVSPVIGHLLHPTFGPWVSFRAVLLLAGRPFGDVPAAPLSWFQPCATCHQPCVAGCPVGTYDEVGSIRLQGCVDHRYDGGCTTGCEVLRRCPVGRDHRYSAEEERFRHAYALFAIAEARAPSWMRIVNGFLRRRP